MLRQGAVVVEEAAVDAVPEEALRMRIRPRPTTETAPQVLLQLNGEGGEGPTKMRRAKQSEGNFAVGTRCGHQQIQCMIR